MGGKKDKKKKAKDPLKKAALVAKKDAKSDKAALRRLQKEEGGSATHTPTSALEKNTSDDENWDAILESYRRQAVNLHMPELIPLNHGEFPRPSRANFTWTYCPTNGLCYLFGGEYHDGVRNVVFDELLRWCSPQQGGIGQWTRILTPPPQPPPRCAHSAVYHNDAIYIFGGESVTSDRYHHYRDLWRLDIKTNTWEELSHSSTTRGGAGQPPPQARSGHRCVVWRHSMILFGGFQESVTNGTTKFFNDVHIYDFQSRVWSELKYGKLARLPPPRSACNLAVMSSSSSSSSLCAGEEALFMYGGYSKVKNTCHVYNGERTGNGGQQRQQQQQQHHGMRKSSSEGIVHVDTWILPLKSLIGDNLVATTNNNNYPPSWERVTRKGEYPSSRAGTSSVMYQKKMIVFGGVIDNEGDHHTMESIFYNDLFALDMERRRWFEIRLREDKVEKSGGRGRRRRRKGVATAVDIGEDRAVKDLEINDVDDEISGDDLEEEDEDDTLAVKNEEVKSSGYGLNELRHDMFAVINENREEVEEVERLTSAIQFTNPTSQNADYSSTQKGSLEIAYSSSSVTKVNYNEQIPVVRETPLPRINCASVVRNNILYIYGGLLEVGDREVTLDDCWSIDLNKHDKWTCIWPGQMHRQVWRGVDSDNESYISSDQGGDGGDDDDSDDNDDDGGSELHFAEFESILEDDDDDKESEEAQKRAAKKKEKKTKVKEERRAIRNEILELQDQLRGGENVEQWNPILGEAVADFYTRTTQYWNGEAKILIGRRLVTDQQVETILTKELKREGFRLANERYEKVKPILERLNELERLQLEYEEKKTLKKKKKSEQKTKKDRSR